MIFEHDGVSIHYVSAGEGQPLVFLHGLGGQLENWINQIAHFAKTHHVIALDLPGHGRSGGGEIGFLDHWRSLDALLDHLGLTNAVICGLSKGARVALMLAARRPERVLGLVAVNAWVHLTPGDRARRCALYDLLQTADGRQIWAKALLEMMGVASFPAISRGFHRSLDRIDPLRLRELFYEMAGFDQRQELMEVSCPVLVVRGAKDAFVPGYSADDLSRLLPRAQQVTLPHRGHLPYLEDPAEFQATVETFLGSLSPFHDTKLAVLAKS